MSEQAERKPLVLKDALDTLGKGIWQSPKGFTTFTVTCKCGATCWAQSMWLAKQLPLWVALLNNDSGAVVLSTRIKFVDERESGRYIDSAIILDLAIKGKMSWKEAYSDSDEDLQINQAGQIRKSLAEKVLADFPPPFCHQSPSFLAKWPITFCNLLVNPLTWEEWQFTKKLEIRLSEFGANFRGVELKNFRRNIFTRIAFNEDTTPEKISSFLIMLDDFFRVNNFETHIPRYPILSD